MIIAIHISSNFDIKNIAAKYQKHYLELMANGNFSYNQCKQAERIKK